MEKQSQSMSPASDFAEPKDSVLSACKSEEPIQTNAQNEEEYTAPSKRIHWNSEDSSKLDLEWHDNIGMVHKGILYGAIITLIIGAIGGLLQSMLIATVPSIIIGVLGIIGALGIEKRKPNSVFLCLVYSWICTISNAISIIALLALGTFPGLFPFIWLVYGIAILYALYSSDDVRLIFPKEYRKVSKTDKMIVYFCVLIVLLLSL